MKIVAVLLNVFTIPGLGSFFVGKAGQAIAQIILFVIGVFLALTGVGAIVGIPLIIGVWIWGIITAANSPTAPVVVNIVHHTGAPNLPASTSFPTSTLPPKG